MLPELNGKLNGMAVRAPVDHRLGRRPHLRARHARPRPRRSTPRSSEAARRARWPGSSPTPRTRSSRPTSSRTRTRRSSTPSRRWSWTATSSRSSPGTTTSGATRTAASSSRRRCSSAQPAARLSARAKRVERARHVLEGERPRRRRRGRAGARRGSTSTSRSPTGGGGWSPTTPGSARRCRRSSCCASAARRSCSSRTSGGPKDRDPELSMAPVAARLGELLGAEVTLAPGVVGPGGRGRSRAPPRRRATSCAGEQPLRARRDQANDPELARRSPALGRGLRQRRLRRRAPRPRDHRTGSPSACPATPGCCSSARCAS